MKRLCHERGAEDNLTAVLVRVGVAAASQPFDANADTLSDIEEEQTIISERVNPAQARTLSDSSDSDAPLLRRPFTRGAATPLPAIIRIATAARGRRATSGAKSEPPPAGAARARARRLFLLGHFARPSTKRDAPSVGRWRDAASLTPVAPPATPDARPRLLPPRRLGYAQLQREVEANKGGARLMADGLRRSPKGPDRNSRPLRARPVNSGDAAGGSQFEKPSRE